MTATPIAIFIYNRPEHARQLFDSLRDCVRLEECDVHVFCDGIKRPEHEQAVRAARAVAREFALRLKANILERDQNLGLARSIVTGVTQLCADYGRVIVLEDDLAVAPDFLNYMLQALDRYQDEPRVYQISGYMFPITQSAQPDAFFMPLTTTWGWATWQRAWQAFDWNAIGAAEQLADPQTKRRFDLDGSYPYSEMLTNWLAGRIQSWGILWWWSVFKGDGLVLHPRRSLVWVGGYDGSGVNAPNARRAEQGSIDYIIHFTFGRPLIWPESIAPDVPAFANVKRFLMKRRGRFRPTWKARLLQIGKAFLGNRPRNFKKPE